MDSATTRLLTPEQVAGRWQVSARTVRRLCESGAVRGLRVGGQWRISPEAVERFEIANAAPERIRSERQATALPVAAPSEPSGGYLPAIGGPVPWREEIVPASPAGGRRRASRTKKAALARN